MKELLALTIPGGDGSIQIEPPAGIPSGGLSGDGGSAIQVGFVLLIITAIILTIFVLILSGIQWSMSGGDKQKIEAARNRIIYSIIGLVIIFLAWLAVTTVGNFFGIDLIP